MNKIVFLIAGILSCGFCFAQEDTQGFGVGLEIFVFDQSKVATDLAPSIFDDKVLQLNYRPLLSYTFAGTSTIGLFGGFGKRNIDYAPENTLPAYSKTKSYEFGLFYKYKFLNIKRFGAYGESAWQFQKITQERTNSSVSYEHAIEIQQIYAHYRKIFSFSMNFKLGIEYRILAGLYFNTYIGNDLIAYENISKDVERNDIGFSEDIFIGIDPDIKPSLWIYENNGHWILFKNYIILGAGLRYQF